MHTYFIKVNYEICNFIYVFHTLYKFIHFFFFLRLPNDDYFYLYRISYMYYIVLGFIVTFVIALIITAIFPESNCDDPNLFTPFVAKRLRNPEFLMDNTVQKVVIFLCTFFKD